MKRSVCLVLTLVIMLCTCSGLSSVALAEERPTLTILTTRQTAGTNDINELWFFKFLSEKFNVNFELEQAFEDSRDQRISLMFGSADLPDIIWGINLSPTQIMTYGQEEGLLLDWTPYLNEETMPNAAAAMKDFPDAFTASTRPDGKIYAMPYLQGSKYYNNTGAFSRSVRVYVNTEWMELCGITEMPKTLDDVLNMLRTFKEKDPKGLGENNMPLVSNSAKFQDYVWHSLGFYGCKSGQEYGTEWAIKNGQVVLPCYTEEAKAFLELWNTMYNEGLFSPDTFTVDKVTRRGWISAGYPGLIGDDTIQYTEAEWPNWVGMPLVTSEYCDKPVAAMNRSYTLAGSYASADTEHPELVAKIIDYMYSEEGAYYYAFGPQKGEDVEYDGYEGWYYDDNGLITCDPVVRGEVNGQSTYVDKMISPCYYIAGHFDRTNATAAKMAGREGSTSYIQTPDQITGGTLTSYVSTTPDPTTWSGHWNLTQVAAMEGKLTGVILPEVYLSTEDNETIADIETVIMNHVRAESAKFITNQRDLSEFDDYMQELRDLGIEEYIDIYTKAFANFIDATFGN